VLSLAIFMTRDQLEIAMGASSGLGLPPLILTASQASLYVMLFAEHVPGPLAK